jgi:hypothetical protein
MGAALICLSQGGAAAWKPYVWLARLALGVAPPYPFALAYSLVGNALEFVEGEALR